jgi:hypothetical protein
MHLHRLIERKIYIAFLFFFLLVEVVYKLTEVGELDQSKVGLALVNVIDTATQHLIGCSLLCFECE